MLRTTSDIADELLVLHSQGGDRAALAVLVKRWHPRLYRHARRLTDGSDSADDATQEAWVAIIRRLRSLDDPARFGPWAYRIVTNKCADRTRRLQRERKHREILNREPPGTDSRADDTEVGRLRSAMRRLPSDRRALLGLFYVDGLSVAQIARALGLPNGTVKSRLFGAREELKRVLERTDDADDR